MTEQNEIEKTEKKEEEGVPFFPHHALKEVSVVFLTISVMLILTALHPATMGPKADPLDTPEHIKPEWYFLPIYQFLKFVPRTFGIVFQMIAFGAIFLWPFIDRGKERNPLRRPVFLVLSLICLIVTIFLGIWGHTS